jgi:arylsulfatase A-like enzyme
VHNTLIALGPDFRDGLRDELPTGNVDVAPTIASILGLRLPRADGRPLLEALRNGPSAKDFQVVSGTFRPRRAVTGIAVKRPTDPDGKDIDPGQTIYSFQLDTKALSYQGKTYMYFDRAKVIRQ